MHRGKQTSLFDHLVGARCERCRLIVANSRTLGEKGPNAPGADPIRLIDRSYQALAQPI